MSHKARIAVIGCGWWATCAHLPALQRNPAAEILAVADPDASRREIAAASFSVPQTFASASALLDNVELDGVVIAAPHALHYELAALALRRRLHVLVEKPMVIEPAHGRDLIDLAQQQGVELIVGYPMHYSSQARAVRAALREGCIGQLEYVSCLFASIVRELYRGNTEAYREACRSGIVGPQPETYSRADDGGQARTQVTHSAALLLWLTGLRPRSVAAMTAEFELDVDLADAVAVQFQGGAIGTISSTGSVLPGEDELLRLEVFGRDGHVIFDVNQGVASLHGAEPCDFGAPSPEDRYPEHAPADNLVDVILGRGSNESPPEIAHAAAVLVAAIHTSATERCFVDCADYLDYQQPVVPPSSSR